MEKQDKTTTTEKPRRGRPPIAPEKVKTKWDGFATTPEEHARLASDVRAAGTTKAKYMRLRLGLSTD